MLFHERSDLENELLFELKRKLLDPLAIQIEESIAAKDLDSESRGIMQEAIWLIFLVAAVDFSTRPDVLEQEELLSVSTKVKNFLLSEIASRKTS